MPKFDSFNLHLNWVNCVGFKGQWFCSQWPEQTDITRHWVSFLVLFYQAFTCSSLHFLPSLWALSRSDSRQVTAEHCSCLLSKSLGLLSNICHCCLRSYSLIQFRVHPTVFFSSHNISKSFFLPLWWICIDFFQPNHGLLHSQWQLFGLHIKS